MEQAKEYKDWCTDKGLKPSDTTALKEYIEEKRIKRSRLFRSKMSLYGDSTTELADYLNIARQTLSRKIDGESDFTLNERSLLKARYNLSDDEYVELFTKEIVEIENQRSSTEIKQV